MVTASHQLLRVPSTDLTALSFCESNVRSMRQWISTLPKANIGETSRQLYNALGELNRIDLPVESRLQLLEAIGPEVDYICQQLSRYFLDQPIVLEARAQQVVNLCQALQSQLTTGYKQATIKLASTHSSHNRDRALLALSIEHAMDYLYQSLVRSCQLYCLAPERLWLDLHLLYRVAAEHTVQAIQLRRSDKSLSPSIEQRYLAALLLACAGTSQLRQKKIALLARELLEWAPLAKLTTPELESSHFIFLPQVDAPPRARALYGQQVLTGFIGINCEALVTHLSQILKQSDGKASTTQLSDQVLQHLITTLGTLSERSFQRRPGNGEQLTLCLGMSSVHYHLAQQRDFNESLHARETNKQSSNTPPADVWAFAPDASEFTSAQDRLPLEHISYSKPDENTEAEARKLLEQRYPLYQVNIVNQSSGGYCIQWPAQVPSLLQAGELLAIQVHHDHWNLAVVRWIRQIKNEGTHAGVELLSPNAQPCGVQLLRTGTPNSQYLRALLLPGIEVLGRPATLLLPLIPFQEGNRVQVSQHGKEERVILEQRLAFSSQYNQFQFRSIVTPTVTAPEETSNMIEFEHKPSDPANRFDALWKSL